MPKKFNIPIPPTPSSTSQFKLPYHGTPVSGKGFSFSFAAFDRNHKLFNLGDDSERSGVVSGQWFIDLLDCLKSVSKMTINEMKTSMHDLHPVDWDKANTSMPKESEQCDYWQFRINKSKGRVIGILTNNVFYIVWLDPHHNLTNSEGYGREKWHEPALSLYETQELMIASLNEDNKRLKEELKAFEELLNQQQ